MIFSAYNAYQWRWTILFQAVTLLLTLHCCAHGQDCGSTLTATDTEQVIESPAVVGPLDCQWTIGTSEPQTYVLLMVESLSIPETQSCEDRIEIWLKGAISDEEVPRKLCGSVGRWNIFHSTEQQMLVRFVTGGASDEETLNFRLTYFADVEVADSRLLWTDRNSESGQTTVDSLPADPQTYLGTGDIQSRQFYGITPGNWLGLAADRRDRTIFFSDSGNNRIVRGDLGKHAPGKNIFEGTSSDVRGITADWMARVFYLTDALYNWILAINYDGGKIISLVSTGLDIPSGIAVHPQMSYLFWTDTGVSPQIERSNLAGEGRQVIISTRLVAPHGITIDFQSQRIYWTNDGSVTNTVESATFDGRDRGTLFSQPSSEASIFHLTSFQDYIFVSDRGAQQLRCARKSAPGSEYFGLNLNVVPYDVAVYDLDSQPGDRSPCESNPCSYLCVGDSGEAGYKCLCPSGYILLPELGTCLDDGTHAKPQLFVALQTRLCAFPSNALTVDLDMTCFLEDRKHAVGIAVDVADKLLFFSDVSLKFVASAKLVVGSGIKLLSRGIDSVEGMAVDWISNNLYWTDNTAGMISVSTYGGYRLDLITTDVIGPRSIAVDPFEKYLFWGESGPPAQIERSDLDGGNRVVLVSEDIDDPNGLAIDYSKKKLYFADASSGAIHTIGYNGQGRSLFYQKSDVGTHNFFGMAIFQDFLVWSESGPGNGLFVANRLTGELVKEHPMPNEALFSVTMYADYTQPGGDGPCAVDNGGCNHLCLPSSRAADGRFCHCVFGYYLADDGVTCDSYLVEDNFALITDSYAKKLYQVDLTDPEYAPNGIPLGTIDNAMAVTYDPIEKKLYWSDIIAETISRAGLDGSYPQVIISEGLSEPEGLALDALGRLLFWTDNGRQTISVSMLSGDRHKTLISDGLDKPRAIALDPREGYMYWSDWGAVPKIERSYMDGTGRQVLISEGLGWPNGIYIDTQGRKLYWCDARVNKIEMSDLRGSNRVTLIASSINIHPYGIGLNGDHLFYTDWEHTSLVRADKLTGENSQLVGSSDLKRPNELHIYNSSIPLEGYPLCSVYNGGCSGLCLSSSSGRTCHCGDAGELASDGTTCVGEDLIQCELLFERGDLGSCTGRISEKCDINCWSGSTKRIESVTCLSTGNWDEDLSTVCEESIPCNPLFEHGDLGSCTGSVAEVCSVNCQTGFTTRIESVICLPSGNWNKDLNTVCEEVIQPTTSAPRGPVITPAPEVPVDSDLVVFIQTTESQSSVPTIGQFLMFNCVVLDDEAEVYWYKDGVALEFDSLEDLFVLDNTIMIIEFDFIHQGEYTCSAHRGSDGAVGESVVRLDLPLDAMYASYPSNTTVELGGNHVLQCSPVNGLHTVIWEKDGDPLNMNEHAYQTVGDNLLLRDATLAEDGIYTCALYSGTQRIAEVSAVVSIDAHIVIKDVCGTITAREAITTLPMASDLVRITGGQKAIHGSAPWMVRLYNRRNRQHFCGASLVNNYWAITAAHCIQGYNIRMEDLLLRLGDYDVRRTDESEETALVQEIRIHEGFNATTLDQDIALLKLREPIYLFDDYIRPICIPNITVARAIYRIGTEGKVTGFGRVSEGGPTPRYMTEINIPLVGKRICRASTDYVVTNNMFCAGFPRETADSCQGDSGGPFAVEYRERWYLLGVVSWGEGCGREGKYGIYTRVPKFLSWIYSIINH